VANGATLSGSVAIAGETPAAAAVTGPAASTVASAVAAMTVLMISLSLQIMVI
jgi:hypothetical protein